MILKASQRGGSMQLAAHLLKAENEHVELHEVRGFVADDLRGAMKEAYAVSKGTRCQQFLFSVSLNPPETASVSVEAFESAIERIEKANGLEGQPRVVVFHEKEGRRHAHAVWSRIDADKMTARPLSHFKLKLREVSKSLYLEHGWQMPRGLMDSKERDPRNFSLSEWQQAKRMGRDPAQLKATVQECWAVSDSRASFDKALEERGLYLAKGDRRAHVAVTYEGEVLSLARMIGVRSKDVTAKLGKADDLRSVADTRAHIASVIAPRLKGLIAQANQNRRQAMQPLNERRKAMTETHAQERQRLDKGQALRRESEARERSGRLRHGLRGLLDRVTGRHASLTKLNEAEAFAAFKRDRAQRDGLIADQLSERRGLQREIRSVRYRHAASVLELHRDLARQNASREAKKPDNERASSSFNRAAQASTGKTATESPRQILRGRGRGTGRDGPGMGR